MHMQIPITDFCSSNVFSKKLKWRFQLFGAENRLSIYVFENAN